MSALKVYGGRYYGPEATRGCRAIVATTSKREVAKIISASSSEVANYWSETGNPGEIAAARSCPGTLLIELKPFSNKFAKANP